MKFDNYECEGQMTIFDFLDEPEEAEEEPKVKDLINDFWNEVPSVLPKNKDWKDALFVLYNQKTNEFHYNMPGEVKDGTFRRPAESPEGEVIAWRYVMGE